MPLNYDELGRELKRIFPADLVSALGRETGFIKRARVVDPRSFLQSAVLSRLGHKPGFEQGRQLFQQLSGATIHPRPYQMRFKQEEVVDFLAAAFDLAAEPFRNRVHAGHALSRRFADVIAWDCSKVRAKNGKSGDEPSMNIAVGISVFGNAPLVAGIHPWNRNDSKCKPPLENFRPGSLFLFDKGFRGCPFLAPLVEAGMQFLTPMFAGATPLIVGVNKAPPRVRRALEKQPEGVSLREVLPRPPASPQSQRRRPGTKNFAARDSRIRSVWDLEVRLIPKPGSEYPAVDARLVILPGPKGEQRPYLTTIRDMSPKALAETYRLRWQIELTFKELKQNLALGFIPTADPHAAKALVWASLLALVLSRRLLGALNKSREVHGLAKEIRASVVTRVMRSCQAMLGIILGSARDERALQADVARLLSTQSAQRARSRPDTFSRLAKALA